MRPLLRRWWRGFLIITLAGYLFPPAPPRPHNKPKDFSLPTGRPSYYQRKYILKVPMPEEKETDALKTGNSSETLILEGDEAYQKRYSVVDRPAFGDQRKTENKLRKEAWERANADMLAEVSTGRKIE